MQSKLGLVFQQLGFPTPVVPMGADENNILDAAISIVISHKKVPAGYVLRQASQADASEICIITKSSTQAFTTIPALADLLEMENISPSTVEKWLELGRICVVEDRGQLVGFAAAHVMDNSLYIDEISTIVEHQRRGIGSLLIEAMFEWARQRKRDGVGEARVSLTTYAESVPWNGPWYARKGFKEVDALSIGPNHAQELVKDAGERKLVREGYRRCAMIWQDSEAESAAIGRA